MNRKQQQFSKIQNYFEETEKDSTGINLFKLTSAFLAGGFLSNGIARFEIDASYLFIGIALFIILFALEWRDISRRKSFPVKILDNLMAEEELQNISEKHDRKIIMDEYFDDAVRELNENTCPINFSLHTGNHEVCRESLEEGLRKVFKNLINNPNHFLNVNKSKFTIGIYHSYIYKKVNQGYNGQILDFDEVFITFRDDLGLGNLLPHNLKDITNSQGDSFRIHTKLLETFNNNKFSSDCIDINNIGHQIITSPIPQVCEDDSPEGVLYVIIDDQVEFPDDLENILLIMGRISANWISKFNNCILDHAYDKKLHAYGINPLIDDIQQYIAQNGVTPLIDYSLIEKRKLIAKPHGVEKIDN